jgi:hypothetical protein
MSLRSDAINPTATDCCPTTPELLAELRHRLRETFEQTNILRVRLNRVHEAIQIFAPDSNEHRLLLAKDRELQIELDEAFLKHMDVKRKLMALFEEWGVERDKKVLRLIIAQRTFALAIDRAPSNRCPPSSTASIRVA